jgi:iron complex outermembrane recepter protein
MPSTSTNPFVAAAFVCAAISFNAYASDEPLTTDPVISLEPIVVTGSRLKRTDTETAGPITIITPEDLRRFGATTFAEALRNLPSNSPLGALNALTSTEGPSPGFSDGASSISLRGLGSNATLVLLNGRRLAPHGLANPSPGQGSFVNIEALPIDVIERIEILIDGASAIYGSEAMAGVVNIILRKTYIGAQANASYAANTEGEYKNWIGGTTMGFGDLKKDGYNIFANWEHAYQPQTTFEQVEGFLNRDEYRNGRFTRTGITRSTYSAPGNYFEAIIDPNTLRATYVQFLSAAPGCSAQDLDENGVCRFNYWPYIQIIPKSQRDSFFSRGERDFGEGLTGFTEFSYSRVQTSYRFLPLFYGDIGPWYAANRGQLVSVPEVLPVGNPNNPFNQPVGFRHVFTELGPSGENVDSRMLRWLAGVKGVLGEWEWESAAMYTSTDTDVISLNQLRRSVLADTILNGTYNFSNPHAGTVKPSDLAVNTTSTGKASLREIDFKASKQTIPLPAGFLGIAAGMEHRRETLDSRPDPLEAEGEIVGASAASAQGHRNVASLFGELSIPILHNLESQIALRADHYSDFGNSTTPKIGIKWRPHRMLALRATYAEGFRAPALSEISQSDVSAFITVVDRRRCTNPDESDCYRDVGLLINANPDLQPETSKSYTTGLIFEPTPSFSMAADYFEIRRVNEIGFLTPDEILANELSDDPRYAGRVVRGPSDQPGVPGPIQSIRTGFYNLGRTTITGTDIDLLGKTNLGTWGKLKTTLGATYYISYQQAADASSPMIEYIGLRDVPRVIGNANITLERDTIATWLTVNYTGRQSAVTNPKLSCETQPDLNVVGVCEQKAWTTLNLGMEYSGLKNLTVSLVVRNIQNKRPVVDPTSQTIPGNLSWNNPYGRYFVFTVNYKF